MAAPNCADVLAQLYDAIIGLQSGERAASVNFGERQVSFQPSQLKDLLAIWRVHYRQCGTGSGYPDLAATAERGPPALSRFG